MEKLLAIVGLTQKAYGRWLFQRLIAGAIIVAGLTVLIGLLSSALIVSIFFLLYQFLMYKGMMPLEATAYTCGLGLLMILCLIAFTIRYMKRLKSMEVSSAVSHSPILNSVFEVATSFMDGLRHGQNMRGKVPLRKAKR